MKRKHDSVRSVSLLGVQATEPLGEEWQRAACWQWPAESQGGSDHPSVTFNDLHVGWPMARLLKPVHLHLLHYLRQSHLLV